MKQTWTLKRCSCRKLLSRVGAVKIQPTAGNDDANCEATEECEKKIHIERPSNNVP